MATAFDRARPRSSTALRVEELLARYPNLSELELAELINLFSYLNMVPRALMAADEHLGPRVESFYRDHGESLGGFAGGRTLIPVLLVAAAVAIGMWWAIL